MRVIPGNSCGHNDMQCLLPARCTAIVMMLYREIDQFRDFCHPVLAPSNWEDLPSGRKIEPVGGQPGNLIIQTSQEIAYPLRFEI
jgi:hypothetical protein